MAIVVETPSGTPGTGVSLRAIWFNAVANPADLCAILYAGSALKMSTGLRAEVRQNANRRRVVIHDERTYESFPLQLEHCSPDQVEWLREHVGQLVCVRDPHGSKAFGMYAEVSFEKSAKAGGGPYYSSATLTLNESDHSEAV